MNKFGRFGMKDRNKLFNRYLRNRAMEKLTKTKIRGIPSQFKYLNIWILFKNGNLNNIKLERL